MSAKRQWLIGVGITLAVGLFSGGYYFLAPRRTPAGQPALTYLAPGNLERFRREFNASATVPRVVALLSLT